MPIGSPPALPRISIFRQSERRTPDRPCLNCGDPMPGNFCRNCGQRKVEVHVSLSRMLLEALDDQFSLNSALPRTLGALMFRPGHLTREYMNGRIVRYIPPLRLYLVTSVLFFLALSLLPQLRGEELDLGMQGVAVTDSAAARPAVPAPVPATPGAQGRITPPPRPPAPPANWLHNVRMKTGNPVIDSIGNARIERFSRMDPRDAARQITSEYLGHVPQMMFVLLPLFAALLKVLYAGSRRFYVEHFVFALHVHAFAFLTYLLMLAIRLPPVVGVLGAWMMLYVLLAMKRVYRQGWIATMMKYGILGMAYVVLLSFGAVATLLVTVLTA
ncbi:MAG: DUF3667 domain-containing protein [Gemmatimonadetes bacterium]|nr:DUF3667 domain-containing protein [Gemmatimonadota bacterium]